MRFLALLYKYSYGITYIHCLHYARILSIDLINLVDL